MNKLLLRAIYADLQLFINDNRRNKGSIVVPSAPLFHLSNYAKSPQTLCLRAFLFSGHHQNMDIIA